MPKDLPLLDNGAKLLPSTTEVPDQDVLAEYGVSPTETDDFARAFTFVHEQLRGKSVKAAAEVAGIPRVKVYDAHHQRMIIIARKIMLSQSIEEIQAVPAMVFDEWKNIVSGLIDTAKNAPFHRDRIQAAELLYEMYVKDAGAPQDTSEARDYLKTSPNFAPNTPMTLIKVEHGGTLNITDKANETPPIAE